MIYWKNFKNQIKIEAEKWSNSDKIKCLAVHQFRQMEIWKVFIVVLGFHIVTCAHGN